MKIQFIIKKGGDKMLCLFCGECCRKNHPTAFHDLKTGCYKLRRIGSFNFCKEYADRPFSCVKAMSESDDMYCPIGMKVFGLTIEQAHERREEGLKLIEELYGEKHGKRFNGRY